MGGVKGEKGMRERGEAIVGQWGGWNFVLSVCVCDPLRYSIGCYSPFHQV